MGVTYSHAPDARRIGDKLVAKHHTDLVDVQIEYLFRSKHSTSHGRRVYGKARKITGLNAFLARNTESPVEADATDEFFVIELAEDLWAEMGPAQREALVDHELCHCHASYDEDNGELVLSLVGHDIEEFADVVERHGIWNDDLKAFVEVVGEQLRLEGIEGDA